MRAATSNRQQQQERSRNVRNRKEAGKSRGLTTAGTPATQGGKQKFYGLQKIKNSRVDYTSND
jgi:hypothetical protein